MMKVYISGALQASRDLPSARALYEAAGSVVRRWGFTPYVPHLHTDPVLSQALDAGSVYKRDIENLTSSGAVVAFRNEPSLGVGAELALACGAGIPVLALRRSGVAVSRFLLGYLEAAGASLGTYDSAELMEAKVRAFLADLPVPYMRAAS